MPASIKAGDIIGNHLEFSVAAGAKLTLEALILQGGTASAGGGAVNNNADGSMVCDIGVVEYGPRLFMLPMIVRR